MANMKNRTLSKLAAACFLTVLAFNQALAAENVCKKTSPTGKNVLIELFTSDGCDSCPPANKWLTSVVKGGDKSVIPVSMHVTYWNHLGWKDEFSNPYFDARQGSYAKLGNARFSYTPGVFLNAREWRGWRGGKRAEPEKSNGETAPVSINLVARRSGDNELAVEATVTPVPSGGGVDLASARLYVLLYEDDLVTRPKAGELKNVQLKHDHVVRDWKIADGIRSDKAIASAFKISSNWNQKNLGVVAFVQSADLKTIHQVVDLPLCL
jgi:hypothetical protein